MSSTIDDDGTDDCDDVNDDCDNFNDDCDDVNDHQQPPPVLEVA